MVLLFGERYMNEKFFDLKKEKQDRMINAALKIFAQNGYHHSSTDDIVKEAGISKGLLFHYFTSKMGLYSFLYDYCVRFLTLELKSSVSESEKDYFKIMLSQEQAKTSVLKSYPYMQAFIDRSQSEDDEDALFATEDNRAELQEIYDGILGQVDSSKFKKDVDPSLVHTMLQYTIQGIMREQLQTVSFNADNYFTDCKKHIEMLKSICY